MYLILYYPPEVRRGEYWVSTRVLGDGSIPVAILPSCQDTKTLTCTQLGSKNKKRLRGSTGLCQFNSLGEYCGTHTASSVFLILVLLHESLTRSSVSNCSFRWTPCHTVHHGKTHIKLR